MTKDNFEEIMGVSYEEFMTLDPTTRDVVLRQGLSHNKKFGEKQISLEERKERIQNKMKERLEKGREL